MKVYSKMRSNIELKELSVNLVCYYYLSLKEKKVRCALKS